MGPADGVVGGIVAVADDPGDVLAVGREGDGVGFIVEGAASDKDAVDGVDDVEGPCLGGVSVGVCSRIEQDAARLGLKITVNGIGRGEFIAVEFGVGGEIVEDDPVIAGDGHEGVGVGKCDGPKFWTVGGRLPEERTGCGVDDLNKAVVAANGDVSLGGEADGAVCVAAIRVGKAAHLRGVFGERGGVVGACAREGRGEGAEKEKGEAGRHGVLFSLGRLNGGMEGSFGALQGDFGAWKHEVRTGSGGMRGGARADAYTGIGAPAEYP